MSIREVAQHFAHSPKIASAVSVATAGTGVGTWFDWLPDDIGKLGVLTGIILSAVLIFNHIRRGHVEYKKAQIELAIMREKDAERIEASLRRRARGEPTRRRDDVV